MESVGLLHTSRLKKGTGHRALGTEMRLESPTLAELRPNGASATAYALPWRLYAPRLYAPRPVL